MELYQLRTFSAVAELGSLARATERLHLSQPAASAQIKALEEEFGFSLFERKPNGLSLTRAGADLLPFAQRILAAASALTLHAQGLRGQVGGRFKFGALFDPTLLRLGEFMSRLLGRHPLLEIEIRHQNSRAVNAGVASGEFDAGIAMGEQALPGITAVTLTRLRYRIVAPAAWREKLGDAKWKDIAALPWISTPKDGSHFQMAEALFRRNRVVPQKVLEADSELIITSLVVAGVGLGLMREDRAIEAHAKGTVVLVGQGSATTSLRYIYLQSRDADPAIQALLEVIRELWPQAG
jgi:DNA-binding transcriptional LysR family regulator